MHPILIGTPVGVLPCLLVGTWPSQEASSHSQYDIDIDSFHAVKSLQWDFIIGLWVSLHVWMRIS